MRKALCLLLAVTLLVAVGGCGIMDWIFPEDKDKDPDEQNHEHPGPQEEGTAVRGRTLYVADMHGRWCLPVTYDVPWEEGIAKAVLRHLVEGGPAQQFLETKGLKAPIPAGTVILGMSIKDGACIVDFSSELLQTADAVHEQLILDAVTYTLTEFATIDTVSIRVNGKALTKMPNGTPVDPVLSRARGINVAASPKGTGAAVTVYMRMDSLAGGTLLVPVTRPVSMAVEPARAALEQLIGGPDPGAGLKPVLPASVRVEGLTLEGNTAAVDFSPELAGLDDLDVVVAAVVLSLTELPGIERVRLTAGGRALELPDGSILAEPVVRPASANPLVF